MSIRPTIGARLFFAWAAVWIAIWTIVFSPCAVLHSAIRPGAATFKLWARLWARVFLFGTGVRVRTENHAGLAEGQPVVFAANHQNSLDILVAAAGIPYPFGFAAKYGLRKLPFIGWVLNRTACLFIDRSTPRRAAESLIEAAARLKSGDSVLLYPEGGRSYSDRLEPFQRGAFVLAATAEVPLVPVALVGDHERLDERQWAFRPGPVRVVVGPPIPTAGRGRGAVPELMEEVRVWMERELARGPRPERLTASETPPAAGPRT